jgi:hypothetical protein
VSFKVRHGKYPAVFYFSGKHLWLYLILQIAALLSRVSFEKFFFFLFSFGGTGV